MSSIHWWFWVLTVSRTKQDMSPTQAVTSTRFILAACTEHAPDAKQPFIAVECKNSQLPCTESPNGREIGNKLRRILKLASLNYKTHKIKPWVNSELPTQKEGTVEAVSSMVTDCLREKIDFWSFLHVSGNDRHVNDREVIDSLSRKVDKNLRIIETLVMSLAPNHCIF